MMKYFAFAVFSLITISLSLSAQKKGSVPPQSFKKMKCQELVEYYGNRLKTRKLSEQLMKQMHPDDIYMLTEFGLPDSVDDYTFKCPIELINSKELRIGEVNGDNVILN